MWAGSVVSIHLAPANGAPTYPVPEVKAVAGAGLEGDRHYRPVGDQEPQDELTLIQSEALEALAGDHGIALEPGEHRRQVVTAGVPLNDLVGHEFQIGTVRLRGIKLNEPCKYLEDLTGRPGLIKGLVHRGGIRAQILTGGTIQVGAPVTPVTAPAASADA
jgi:MOSC domain-containing protein YiiM